MGVWKQLANKWFGLTDEPCETCDILRMQLAESNAERKDLLYRLLDQNKAEPPSTKEEERPIPITPQHIPWRVRQQMLEAEDREKARIMKEVAKKQSVVDLPRIEDLEKELGVVQGE